MWVEAWFHDGALLVYVGLSCSLMGGKAQCTSTRHKQTVPLVEQPKSISLTKGQTLPRSPLASSMKFSSFTSAMATSARSSSVSPYSSSGHHK